MKVLRFLHRLKGVTLIKCLRCDLTLGSTAGDLKEITDVKWLLCDSCKAQDNGFGKGVAFLKCVKCGFIMGAQMSDFQGVASPKWGLCEACRKKEMGFQGADDRGLGIG